MKKFKKALAMTLTLAMTLGVMSFTALVADNSDYCSELETVEVEAVEVETEKLEIEENQNAGIMAIAEEDTDVAQIGDNKYTSLSAAITAAVDGQTVKLLDSIALASSVNVTAKSITIDLNGNSITRGSGNTTSYLIGVASGATLTITDSSSGGEIDGSTYVKNGSTYAGYSILTNGETIVESGTLTGYYGISVSGDNAELTVTGGTVSGTARGINLVSGEVTIEGGTISGGDFGVIQFGGTLEITDGEITGSTAVKVQGGDTNITGGTIKGTSTGVNFLAANGSISATITGDSISGGSIGIYISNHSGTYEATLTIGTEDGDDESETTGGGNVNGEYGIYITNGADVIVNSGTISNGYDGIVLFGGDKNDVTTLTVNGGTISGSAFGISTNGSNTADDYCGNNEITINGGTIIGGATGMYLSAVDSKTTINGGTITGSETGIEIRAGELTVTDGTITGGTTDSSSTSNGSGTTTTGAGIAVSQHSTNQEITVNISGGEISGYYGVYEINTYASQNDQPVTIKISGDTEVIATNTEGEAVYSYSISKDNTSTSVDTTIEISGGNYSTSVDSEYLAYGYNTELYTSSELAGYSYYPSTSAALTAAADMENAVIRPVSTTSGTYYKLTFDAGSGTCSVESITEKSGETVSLPTATRSGYTFDGWKTGSKTYKAGYSYTVEDNVTFTAQWTKKTTSSSYSLSETTGSSTSSDEEEDNTTTDTTETTSTVFTDLSTDHSYYDAIMEAYENGWMVGTSATTFEPDAPLTRAMAAKILHNLAGNPDPEDVAPFLDVLSGEWYSDAIAWAYEQGLIIGYDYINFGPDDYVTTEQFSIMLAKFYEQVVPDYVGGAPNATRGWIAYMITA